MVGVLLVSHSKKLVDGVYELIQEMNHAKVPVTTAGGTDNEENPIGTDPMKIYDAMLKIFDNPNYKDGDGIVVLMDIGSALMSAEAAIDFIQDENLKKQIHLCSAPLVEGGIVAMCTSMTNANIDKVLKETKDCLKAKESFLNN